MIEKTLNMTDEKIAYLGLIQGVINRMATVSATCKGFATTMFAGVLAVILSIGGANRIFALGLTALPIVMFACFDCYYYAKERQYRSLYCDVLNDVHSLDFDMSVPKCSAKCVWRSFRSKSVWLFYLAFIVSYGFIVFGLAVGILS